MRRILFLALIFVGCSGVVYLLPKKNSAPSYEPFSLSPLCAKRSLAFVAG
ncbi:MAG: hypothetical protein HYS08_05745 [Chlamydiae bacterium]|nr:hypothetical protein [Chlamydiota bacterium]MBI3267221.1 hypothetical protein [Chlamydiota bacterium]